MKPEVKKLILSNLPYLIFVYLFGKLGQAYRLAAYAVWLAYTVVKDKVKELKND